MTNASPAPQPSPAGEVETASWARRFLALFVDWVACTLIVILVIGKDNWLSDRYAGFYVMGVFVAESALLTATLGGSFGKLVTRLRVERLSGGLVDPLRSVVRALLVALVIPPVVYRPDGRGLHDLLLGTRTVVHNTSSSAR